MSADNRELYKNLWNIANVLRGKMDPDEFKNYILGFIFFKYLSERLEKRILNEISSLDELKILPKNELDKLKDDVIKTSGYYFNTDYLFSKIISDINNGDKSHIVDFLEKAFNEIVDSTIGEDSNDDFKGLFADINLYNPKLGSDDKEVQNTLSQIIKNIADIDLSSNDEDNDILGDAYEYLISMFASSAGKKGGEFYTPSGVSKILAKIVSTQEAKIKTIYDPTCGSGSLLIKAYRETIQIKKYGISDLMELKIRGQELNHTTYNLARMNMFLHGVNYTNFKLKQGDTIRNDKFEGEKFNAIVANPPFGTSWNPSEKDYSDIDKRFSRYEKLAPASRAEYTFVQHMLEHLDQDGLMATVLPHGVLFRGGAEGMIRQHIIEQDNALDAIIGLPSNLFFGTGIPAIIAVYKKCRKSDEDILFIDASKGFEKIKNQNKLRDIDIENIVDIYVQRKEIDKDNNDYDLISINIPISEIKENGFNLNISRYVDDSKEIKYRELSEIDSDLEEVENEKRKLKKEIEILLKEFKF